jgi:hypothetical protein
MLDYAVFASFQSLTRQATFTHSEKHSQSLLLRAGTMAKLSNPFMVFKAKQRFSIQRKKSFIRYWKAFWLNLSKSSQTSLSIWEMTRSTMIAGKFEFKLCYIKYSESKIKNFIFFSIPENFLFIFLLCYMNKNL